MVVEIVMCAVALTVSVALAAAAVVAARRRALLRVLLTAVGFLALHFIAYNLVGPHMRGYVYATNIPDCEPYECPFKGVPYESATMTFKKQAASAPEPQMYRTFQKEWWNVYRWHDYATHPRWGLPYRARETVRRPNPGVEADRDT